MSAFVPIAASASDSRALRMIVCRQGYDELLPHTEILSDGSLTIRVLDLPTLIDVKAKTGHAKDRAVLPVLIATLEERRLR